MAAMAVGDATAAEVAGVLAERVSTVAKLGIFDANVRVGRTEEDEAADAGIADGMGHVGMCLA